MQVRGTHGNSPWHYGIKEGQSQPIGLGSGPAFELPRPVFLPAIDMIGHSKGYLEADGIVELDFDSTCRDLVELLGVRAKTESGNQAELLSKLSEVVVGEFEQDDSKRFYLVNDKGRFPMPMIAEGLRKVATLRRLVENNWIVPGSYTSGMNLKSI